MITRRSLSLVFERAAQSVFRTYDGDVLFGELEMLEILASGRSVRTLTGFDGYAMAEDEFQEESELPRWYLPADAITTVDALLLAVQEAPGYETSAKVVGPSLEKLKQSLETAAAQGAKFYFDAVPVNEE